LELSSLVVEKSVKTWAFSESRHYYMLYQRLYIIIPKTIHYYTKDYTLLYQKLHTMIQNIINHT